MCNLEFHFTQLVLVLENFYKDNIDWDNKILYMVFCMTLLRNIELDVQYCIHIFIPIFIVNIVFSTLPFH